MSVQLSAQIRTTFNVYLLEGISLWICLLEIPLDDYFSICARRESFTFILPFHVGFDKEENLHTLINFETLLGTIMDS